ncbi:MAG: hypothetical protein NT126_03965 [Bacteroidetes bacterium]|nr:hypothetical protein [Bacteroidota bacterium]
MLSIVRDKSEIKKYHEALGRLMRVHSTGKPKPLKAQTRGGQLLVSAYHNNQNNYWWSNSLTNRHHKFKNLIGLDPDFSGTNQILIQINYQKAFTNFREAALWASDLQGNVYLLHSGRMGGGVSGINVENIDKLYSGSRSWVSFNSEEYEYYTVCQLNSSRAYSQILSFIKQIISIKAVLKGGENSHSLIPLVDRGVLKNYSPEFWGKRKAYYCKARIESDSDHGLIVDCLKKELESRMRFKGCLRKNKYIDLGIVQKKQAKYIFEVKTSINMQAIYAAIGQLMLHSHSTKNNPDKYIVLPDQLNTSIEQDIAALGINTLRYKWKNEKAIFTNIKNHF